MKMDRRAFSAMLHIFLANCCGTAHGRRIQTSLSRAPDKVSEGDLKIENVGNSTFDYDGISSEIFQNLQTEANAELVHSADIPFKSFAKLLLAFNAPQFGVSMKQPPGWWSRHTAIEAQPQAAERHAIHGAKSDLNKLSNRESFSDEMWQVLRPDALHLPTPHLLRLGGERHNAPIVMRSINDSDVQTTPEVTHSTSDDSLSNELPVSRRRALDKEFFAIAIPALAGLAIDPLASLVDTAMLGRHCSSADLAGVGVAISVFSVVSRTFNFLSSATTSVVASLAPLDAEAGVFDLEMARGAAAALAVAVCIGLVLAVCLSLGGGFILSLLGQPSGSPVRIAAWKYLAARALSFPASLSLMALQGAFRGVRDTKAPLGAFTLATVLNIILDPLLIVALRWGVVGAAVATTVSQYVAALVLWRRMSTSCGDVCTVIDDAFLGLPKPTVGEMLNIARQGSWLTIRTFSGSTALAFSSISASAIGAVQGAAHQICYQLWLATSLLADAVAIAAQALTASAMSQGDTSAVRFLFWRTMLVSAVIGAITAGVLWICGRPLCALFSKDKTVLAAAAIAWPLVVLSQPLNTLAFGVDGLLFGASDFRFCAFMMVTSAIPAMLTMKLAPVRGLPAVWAGLGLYMAARTLIGSARIVSGSGPWSMLWKS